MSVLVVARGVGRWSLRQGQDPRDILAQQGWSGTPVRAVRGSDGSVELHYAVTPRDAAHPPEGIRPSRTGASVLQRVAAYALVVDAGRLLMSRLSARVPGVEGLWTLPGGGVDPGEEPMIAVVREVQEETGQHVLVDDLVQVQSQHWLEPEAPGRHEDMHAIRLIHRAHCPRPLPAQVMELDGSTGEAAWVPLGEVPQLQVAGMVTAAWPFVPGADSYPL